MVDGILEYTASLGSCTTAIPPRSFIALRPDVPASSPFFEFVETAVANGIVSGYACGGPGEPCNPPLNRPYFRPNNLVTRGQLSKITVVAALWQTISPKTPTFADVPPTNTFYTFIETAYCHQIISGYACGGSGEPCPGLYFRPSANATRGQISKIVYLGILDEAGCITGPTGSTR